jgi:hypothetical protein
MSDAQEAPTSAPQAAPAPSSLREVYIARFEMSSPNQTAERHYVDDMHESLTLEFAKEVRDKISSVRNKYRGLILKGCLHFHGLQVVRRDAVDEVQKFVDQADIELKAIDPRLGANLLLIPLSVDAAARGELYEAVVSAIRGQVYTVLLDRLKGLAAKDDVPMRSRTALLDLCDRMKSWNVVGDPDIEKSIANYRRLFQEGILKPVAEEIQKIVSAQDNPAAYVEL